MAKLILYIINSRKTLLFLLLFFVFLLLPSTHHVQAVKCGADWEPGTINETLSLSGSTLNVSGTIVGGYCTQQCSTEDIGYLDGMWAVANPLEGLYYRFDNAGSWIEIPISIVRYAEPTSCTWSDSFFRYYVPYKYSFDSNISVSGLSPGSHVLNLKGRYEIGKYWEEGGSEFTISAPTPTPTSTPTPTPTPIPTPTPSHKECNANDQCVSVTGAGTDQCTIDANCVAAPTPIATHKECNASDQCVSVTGAGTDQCTIDANCVAAPTPTPTPISYGTIQVKATLDGDVWSGNVNYTLSGRDTVVGIATPANYSNVSVGSYTISVTSGGPENTILDSVSPVASLLVLANQTTTFTLNFKTIIGASHKACNVSKQCVTIIGAGADECTNDASCTTATHKACNASKQCVYVAGSGDDTCTDDISCRGGVSHKACNASKQCVSVLGAGADQCINNTSCALPPISFVCNFSWSPESPKAKTAVDFFDYTQTPKGTTLTSWVWTFQDGTPLSSSIQSPAGVIFNSAGEKTVTLSATNSDNNTCTLSQQITVQSLNPKWIEVIPK